MHRLTKITATLAGVSLALALSACSETETTAEKAAKARNQGVDSIRKTQPVSPMTYSPTLETINRWAKTWGQKGKVSYVYMQRQDGTFAGYYVIDGLPVNYCVSGSPTYDLSQQDVGDSNGKMQLPAPGLDGAYYGGCDASRYYGFDAVTGQYVEYTDGMVLTAVLSDSPLPLDKQPAPFGSSIEDVKKRP